ncbi:hypothetical protein GCM10025776_10760 [Corallincola platygyrae]
MFFNGVSVVCRGDVADSEGMSIAWFTQVETDHLVLSLPGNSDVTDRLLDDSRFTLSVLSECQVPVAKMFGGSQQKQLASDIHWQEEEALEMTEWGIPAVKNACGVYLCEVVSEDRIEGQRIVIAKMLHREEVEGCIPLPYRKTDYF